MSKPKIRVLQLVNRFAMGGAERVVLSLAMHTDRDRFEVIPCAWEGSGPLEDEFKAAGITCRVLGRRRRSVLTGPLFAADLRRIVVALTDLLKAFSIDIVHCHLTHATLLGLLATRRRGSPPVCTTVQNVIFYDQRGRLSPRA